MTMRLQRYLALCGVASRRASESLIREGRVTVNGAPAVLGATVDPESDEIRVNGKRIHRERPAYLLLHKPKGTITTVDDPHGRKTVLDCLQGVRIRVYPVGRLDLDVSGVLLFTNDGELAQRLTHPRYGVTKVYIATVRGLVSDEALRRLETGVALADGLTAPAEAAILARGRDSTRLRLALYEGRKREVKRMCAKVGHPVVTLRRTHFAGLEVGSLRPGQWRWLRSAEVAQLRRLVKLS